MSLDSRAAILSQIRQSQTRLEEQVGNRVQAEPIGETRGDSENLVERFRREAEVAGAQQHRVLGQEDAVEVVHQIKDLHVTVLRLLGLEDNKLTYFHGGRFKQLSQTGGTVIEELIG